MMSVDWPSPKGLGNRGDGSNDEENGHSVG